MIFVKQKTAYEMRISDWSSDECSSDLLCTIRNRAQRRQDFRSIAFNHRAQLVEGRLLAQQDQHRLTVGAFLPSFDLSYAVGCGSGDHAIFDELFRRHRFASLQPRENALRV